MSFRSVILSDSDDLTEGSRNDSFLLFDIVDSHHSMGLSTSRLPVREDSSIITVNDVIY